MSQIVVVTEGGAHIWTLVNAISAEFGPIGVLVETPISKGAIIRGRMKRQGIVSAAGQLGTMVLVRLLKRVFHHKKTAVPSAGEPPAEQIMRIASADGPEFLAALDRIRPDVVLLAGCRMLSRSTLRAIRCPVLNYHAGIAPKYRGMNGGYWALAMGDAENFGTTVHMVDEGVDTGGVLYQAFGHPAPGDTIATYPLTQAAFSGDICRSAISDALARTLRPVEAEIPSGQWFHPTVWFYLWTGVTKGVW